MDELDGEVLGDPKQRRSLHLFLGADLLHGTAQALGNPRLLAGLPDALLLEDPVVLATGRALWAAVEQRADALHADSLAQSLALHMVYGRLLGNGRPRRPGAPRAMSGSVLEGVIDYMHEHQADVILLDDLSRVANISKYHFLRLFTQATGATPHRYLTRVRMQRAAVLLRTSQEPVRQISIECGYASPGQLAAAFRRHYSATPTEYRRALSR